MLVFSPLEHIFGSKTRIRILNLFFANPGKSFYLREISRRIGIRLNSVRREMENLKKVGIVNVQESKNDGGTGKSNSGGRLRSSKKFFVADTNFLIYPELRALLVKGYLFLKEDLLKSISKLGAISLVVLSGIFTGEKDSAVDMLIVGKLSPEKLARLINSFEKELGLEIKYTLINKAEYQYRKLIGDQFLFSILGSKHLIALDKMPKG